MASSQDLSPRRVNEPVEIDREEEPWRWRCPNGHTSWDRTNNHVWCPSCRRALESEARLNVQEAEHYEIVDEVNDVTIPYEQVEFARSI